jgi:hypothetical protein
MFPGRHTAGTGSQRKSNPMSSLTETGGEHPAA